MKKNIALFILLFVSFVGSGQTPLPFISVPTTVPSANTFANNTPFEISINATNPPGNCASQTITLNIGNLTYLPNSDYSGTQIGNAVVTPVTNTTTGNTTLTISGITSTAGGLVQLLKIGVKFKANVCDGTSISIDGSATSSCNTTPFRTSVPLQVTALTTNKASINFYKVTTNTPDIFCLGDIVKYNILVYNSDNYKSGYDINNPSIEITIPKCAVVYGLYKFGTYDSSSINQTIIQTSTTTQTIKITRIANSNLPLTTNYNYSQDYSFDLFLKYSCNSPGVSPCVSSNNLSATLKGTKANCGTFQIASTGTVTTSLNLSCSNNCNGGGVGDFSITNYSYYMKCNSSCQSSSVYFYLNTPVNSVALGPRTFTISIPNQITATGAYVNDPCPSNPATKIFLDASGNPLINQDIALARFIRWTFNCNQSDPSTIFTISYNYNALQLPLPTSLTFDCKYKLLNPSTDLINYSTGPIILPACQKTFSIYKLVRKKNVPDFAYEANGLPNDSFIYSLSIDYSGDSNANSNTLTDVLDNRLNYIGNFKYSYTNSNSFTPLIGNSFNIPNLGTNIITLTPPSNTNNNTLTLSGLDYTCNRNTLYLEFEVKMKNNVVVDQFIPNRVTITNDTSVSTSNQPNIKVASSTTYTTNLSARCINTPNEPWKDSEIIARNGDILEFKMNFKNVGTVPVPLLSLINKRPQIGDNHQITISGNTSNVNSAFPINYVCDIPTIVTNILPTPLISNYTYNYSNTTISNPSPVWQPTCSTNSNWLQATLPPGLLIKNGEFVDIIFKAKVAGGINGQISYNDFSFTTGPGFNSTISNVLKINYNNSQGCNPPPPCFDCNSFDLDKTTKYLVSAWVKEEDPLLPEKQFKEYNNSCVKISFLDTSGEIIPFVVNPTTSLPGIEFLPTGEIIDGWQRIIGEFIIPPTVDDMKLELVNKNIDGVMAYFDDVRILPSKGNMKSFVYDQKTQRLMAELDENNYSTFYEYDLEGGLVRIKKETEKGVFTIQETRSGNMKK